MKKILLSIVIVFLFIPNTSFGITALECQQQGIPDDVCNAMMVDGTGGTDTNPTTGVDARSSNNLPSSPATGGGLGGGATGLPNGRAPSGGSGTDDSACHGEDSFCKKSDGFCRINGVCVPIPKGKQEGLLGATTIFGFISVVLTWLLTFAGIIATVFLIIGGYQYITAAGNEEQSEKGKKTLMNAIMGIVLVVLSYAIVAIITNTLGQGNPVG